MGKCFSKGAHHYLFFFPLVATILIKWPKVTSLVVGLPDIIHLLIWFNKKYTTHQQLYQKYVNLCDLIMRMQQETFSFYKTNSLDFKRSNWWKDKKGQEYCFKIENKKKKKEEENEKDMIIKCNMWTLIEILKEKKATEQLRNFNTHCVSDDTGIIVHFLRYNNGTVFLGECHCSLEMPAEVCRSYHDVYSLLSYA